MYAHRLFKVLSLLCMLMQLNDCVFILVASHALLQQENPEYNAKRDELFNYYHPIEYDPQIPVDEKTKLMEEWYAYYLHT